MFTLFLIVTVTFLLIFWCLMRVKTLENYWKNKRVVGPEPYPVIGNIKTVLQQKEHIESLLNRIYRDYPEEKVIGIFVGPRPALLLRDPAVIKQVLVKDFAVFQDRGFKATDHPINQNLFSADPYVWRILRQKLSPIFTTGKLKSMMPLFNECAAHLVAAAEEARARGLDLEMRSLASKYSLEAIASYAFGIEVNAHKDPNNTFLKMLSSITEFGSLRKLRKAMQIFLPGVENFLYKYMNISLIKEKEFRFFVNLVNKLIKERQGKPKLRKDLMDLMIEIKERSLVETKNYNIKADFELTPEIIAAQALVFFTAAFESASLFMSQFFYDLALHPDAQEIVFKEICDVIDKHGGEITIEALNEMTYLNMCFEEILRKGPNSTLLVRKSMEDYTFTDLGLTINKGTHIFIPLGATHKDPKYFEDPEDFKPERFSPENRGKIASGTYIPFGDGPRNCIGMRFGKLQMLIGTVAILRNFKVEPCSKTPSKIEIDMSRYTFSIKGGMWLKFTRR